MKYLLLATMLGAANAQWGDGTQFTVGDYNIIVKSAPLLTTGEESCNDYTSIIGANLGTNDDARALCNLIFHEYETESGLPAKSWSDAGWESGGTPGGCWSSIEDEMTGAANTFIWMGGSTLTSDTSKLSEFVFCIAAPTNPTCDTHTCTTGTNKGAGVECTTGTCDDATCCNNPTCDAGFTCPAGSIIKTDLTPPCAGPTCENSDCCDVLPTCTGYAGCGGSNTFKDQLNGGTCAAAACTPDECCEEYGICPYPQGCDTNMQLGDKEVRLIANTFDGTANRCPLLGGDCTKIKDEIAIQDLSETGITWYCNIANSPDSPEPDCENNLATFASWGYKNGGQHRVATFSYINSDDFHAQLCACTPPPVCNDACSGQGTDTLQGDGSCQCVCNAGWEGATCGTETPCTAHQDGNPCQNGATIDGTIPSNNCVCNCATGYDGDHCENTVPCAACVNGGVLSGSVAGGDCTCTCAAGYTGATCQTNIDDCAANPCQNGGTCADGVDSFTCTCATGYTGTTCTTNIDDCAPQPCQHGGTCTDGVNAYTCACLPEYTGTNCETIDLQPIDRATRKKCGSLDPHYCERKGGTFETEKEHRFCPSTGCDETCCKGIADKTCATASDICTRRGHQLIANPAGTSCGKVCTPKECCTKPKPGGCGVATIDGTQQCNYDDSANIEHNADLCFPCLAPNTCDNKKCTCQAGYGGVACDKKISAYARQSKLTDIRTEARAVRKDKVKAYVKDLVRAAKEAGGNLKQVLKDNAMAVAKEDLPVTMATVISKIPRITAMSDNEGEEDNCDTTDAATCGMIDLADDRTDNSQTILEAGDSDGSWTVVVDGTQILSKQTKTGNSYDMQCWEDTEWGTPINKATGETFQCHGRVLFVGSQTGVCDETTCQNGGTCYSTGSGYGCVCTTLWTGDHCELPNTSGNDGTSGTCAQAIERVDKIAYQNLGCPCNC